MAAGQFAPIKDHLRALRDVSEIVNNGSGKVVHEVVTDGSVYFGANADAGNTDETVKFPSAVALVWRWTGDNRFRDDMYDFAVRNLHYVFRSSTPTATAGPRASATSSARAWARRSSTSRSTRSAACATWPTWPAPRATTATGGWAGTKAATCELRFEGAWWMPEIPQHADSLGPANEKIQQRHWIGVTPMEAELVRGGRAVPGLTTAEHGNQALDLREKDCYGDDFGLFHTGGARVRRTARSDVPASETTFTLNTAIMAVGEGNYGRLGPASSSASRRPTAGCSFPPRRAAGRDAGDRPVARVRAGRLEGQEVHRARAGHAGVGQLRHRLAVVHQQLGVRPDLGRGRLEVVPQVPPGQNAIAGKAIRLGSGEADVSASVDGNAYTTAVTTHAALHTLTLGYTLPAGTAVADVRLDGKQVAYATRDTNRGREVTVDTAPGAHTLVVRAG